jgi:hypothetical protein
VPFRSALTAPLVVQLSVELPPQAMVVGFALMPAFGGPVEPTMIVADEVAVAPEELLAMNV